MESKKKPITFRLGKEGEEENFHRKVFTAYVNAFRSFPGRGRVNVDGAADLSRFPPSEKITNVNVSGLCDWRTANCEFKQTFPVAIQGAYYLFVHFGLGNQSKYL